MLGGSSANAQPFDDHGWRIPIHRPRIAGLTAPKLFSAADLTAVLEALSDELATSGGSHELVVVGGAAVVLGYGAHRATRDVDVYEIDSSVRAAARVVGKRLGISEDWLSDGARSFMRSASKGRRLLELPHLAVFSATSEQLLAMKLCAGRDETDWQDAALLLPALRGDRDQVRLKLEPYWVPGKQQRGLANFEDLWEEIHHAD